MGRRIKIEFQGQEHEAECVEINQSNERWNEYLLEDGGVLKLKAVATDVVRLVGQYDGEGNPVYVIKSRNIVAVTVPDQLKKKTS